MLLARAGMWRARAHGNRRYCPLRPCLFCFRAPQHEFVEAERRILRRKDAELTSLAGYAGGNAGAKNGKVCYHNAAMMSDYGSLGHAEVVALQIPSTSFGQFAEEYFALFDTKGNRPDQSGDRGPEYRNLVGVPGGAKGPYSKALVDASIATGDKLDFAAGKGDDPDARAVAFVMDSTAFPFYQAEPYHQFHVRERAHVPRATSLRSRPLRLASLPACVYRMGLLGVRTTRTRTTTSPRQSSRPGRWATQAVRMGCSASE